MSRLISRDPFAREELHRLSVIIVGQYPHGGCAWCGNHGRALHAVSGNPRFRLYVYFTETDAGRRHTHAGQFCSKSCHDSFHA